MQKGHSNLLLLISLCGLSALGQQGSEGKPLVPNGGTSEVRQTQESGTALTNADIVGMLKAGARESEIIAAIRANPTKFDLSADALIALRKTGVNNKILEAMVERGKTEMNLPSARRGVNGGTEADELSSQPYPPKGEILGRGAQSADQQLKAELAKTRAPGKIIQGTKNQRTIQANNGAIGLLQRQRQAADIEAAQMKRGVRGQAPAGMLGQQSQLMSASGRVTTSPMIQPAAGVGVTRGNNPPAQTKSPASQATTAAPATVEQIPSPGKIGPTQTLSAQGTIFGASTNPPQGTSATQPVSSSNSSNASGGGSAGKVSASVAQLHNATTSILSCVNDPSMRIMSVSGSSFPATFTPIDQYNLYTITGCSFGNQAPTNDPGPTDWVHIYGGKGSFDGKFAIKFWSDNEIEVSLDSSLSGFPDLDNLNLVVKRGDGQQTQKGGFKFYAARQTVPLKTVPQSWVTLFNSFGGFDTEYSSPPVSALAGTHPNPTILPPGPSAGSMYVSRSMDGHKPSFPQGTYDADSLPYGPNDYYDFSRLATGWTTDSFQLTSYDQYCPWTVTYRQNFGNWSANWDGDNIRVAPAFTVCSGFDPTSMEFGVPLRNYQNWDGSYYALQVWVTGPRGTDPLTDQPTNQ